MRMHNIFPELKRKNAEGGKIYVCVLETGWERPTLPATRTAVRALSQARAEAEHTTGKGLSVDEPHCRVQIFCCHLFHFVCVVLSLCRHLETCLFSAESWICTLTVRAPPPPPPFWMSVFFFSISLRLSSLTALRLTVRLFSLLTALLCCECDLYIDTECSKSLRSSLSSSSWRCWEFETMDSWLRGCGLLFFESLWALLLFSSTFKSLRSCCLIPNPFTQVKSTVFSRSLWRPHSLFLSPSPCLCVWHTAGSNPSPPSCLRVVCSVCLYSFALCVSVYFCTLYIFALCVSVYLYSRQISALKYTLLSHWIVNFSVQVSNRVNIIIWLMRRYFESLTYADIDKVTAGV